MPLVIMCGLPSSGKSERAKELHDFLLSLSKTSVLIQDENVMSPLSRNQLYSGYNPICVKHCAVLLYFYQYYWY